VVRVEINAGELLDKLTILRIKAERVTDQSKLMHVHRELAWLEEARTEGLPQSVILDDPESQLKEINECQRSC
jgi:hypothetical protein